MRRGALIVLIVLAVLLTAVTWSGIPLRNVLSSLFR